MALIDASGLAMFGKHGVPGPGMFPTALSIAVVALGLTLAVVSVIRRIRNGRAPAGQMKGVGREFFRAGSVWVGLTASIPLMGLIGFVPATILLIGYLILLIERIRGLTAVLVIVRRPGDRLRAVRFRPGCRVAHFGSVRGLLSRHRGAVTLVEELGERWHLLSNGYKAYPSGSLTHPSIDAILALRAEHGFGAGDVARVRAMVNTKAATVTGKVDPRTGLDTKFSLTHGVAVALTARPRPDHYTDTAALDPEISTLRGIVDVRADDSVGKRAAVLTVDLTDGRSLTHRVDDNTGTPNNPMTDAELSAKFTDNTAPRLGAQDTARLLDACWSIESATEFRGLVRMTRVRR